MCNDLDQLTTIMRPQSLESETEVSTRMSNQLVSYWGRTTVPRLFAMTITTTIGIDLATSKN